MVVEKRSKKGGKGKGNKEGDDNEKVRKVAGQGF